VTRRGQLGPVRRRREPPWVAREISARCPHDPARRSESMAAPRRVLRLSSRVRARAATTSAKRWPVQPSQAQGRPSSSTSVLMRRRESRETSPLPSPLEHRRGKPPAPGAAGPVGLVLAALRGGPVTWRVGASWGPSAGVESRRGRYIRQAQDNGTVTALPAGPTAWQRDLQRCSQVRAQAVEATTAERWPVRPSLARVDCPAQPACRRRGTRAGRHVPSCPPWRIDMASCRRRQAQQVRLGWCSPHCAEVP
jgi:hypothetical protein